jgi:hypothetical protein
LDWSKTLKVIEFNSEKLKEYTKLGIVASSSKELQRLMNVSW